MGYEKKEAQVIILAGGLGTRLKPLTEKIPKPLVKINGKPFLEYKIKKIKDSGIENIILCVGYLGNLIERYFGDGKNFGVNIKYSYEEKLLGTAGAIKNAEKLIDSDTFIVMNGDTYLDINLGEFLSFHRRKNSLVAIAVTSATNKLEQELIDVKNEQICNFYKRDTLEHKDYLKNNSNPLINAGVYVFNKEILSLIPPGIKVSLEQEIFPILPRMSAFEFNGYIKDIANIQFCRELEQDLTEGKIK
jgi:NDP-sugar pyrophosphorylase family protein